VSHHSFFGTDFVQKKSVRDFVTDFVQKMAASKVNSNLKKWLFQIGWTKRAEQIWICFCLNAKTHIWIWMNLMGS